MKRKYYHMIIQRPADWTGETRREYIGTKQGAAPPGWICVGVCGYHEKEIDRKTGKERC